MPSTVITTSRIASSSRGGPVSPGAAKGGAAQIKPVLKHFVLQVTLAYALISAVWIAFSDWVLASLPVSSEWMVRISMLKGWVFVGVTALLLHETLRRALRRLEQATKSYIDSQSAMRQWADAFTNCAHGITICNPENDQIVACNPAFARMHLCTVDEMVGASVFERYDESVQEAARRSTMTADQTGRASLEAVVRRKDRSTFHAQIDWVTVRDEEGRLLYRVTTIQDITERKRAEQALRESESGMAAAQRVGGFGSWELDLRDQQNLIDNALRWSDQCYRIFGYAPNEMPVTAGLFLEHVHPDDRETMIARAQAAIQTGERFESEHRIVLRGGEVRSVREVGEVVRDRDTGRAVKLVGTVHDTTARLQAAAALRESEARFRAVVENIHQVFWMSNATRDEVLYVSPSYQQVWGRTPESVYQNPLSWMDAIHEEDRERIRSLRDKRRTGNYDEEYRIVRPDGQIRWVRDKAFPVRNANGEIERIVGMAEDTTERKTLEAQFLRAQRMEAIGTLAGGIAHDLNNILAPMLMAAGLLKENTRDPHDREMLGMVERGARRGSEIIRQLLTFSRGVSGERVPIEVRHLVKEMGAIVRETFPREIALSESTPRTLWPVVADATQLHQVLVNLCVNARDAMPRGGKLSLFAENVTLAESALRDQPEARPGPYVMLGVSDTGTGIAPELMDRIFDPFFTTKDLGKGTGLGLSTVLGIVRSHAGFVAVESRIGAGSTFRVYLPASTPAETAERTTPQSEPLPSGQGELILVVDDEEAIRESTRLALETHNYRALTASNGKEAVTRFLQHRQSIRLVLTDMMMPEMGGTALIRALRLLNPAVRVVATSGLQPDGNQEELEKLGIKEVLPKPCGPRALLEAVRRQLA